MRLLFAAALLFVSGTAGATASSYDSLTISTNTGRARRAVSGFLGVAASSQTPKAYTILLDGPKGGVNASSGTFVYGVKAGTFNAVAVSTWSIHTSSGVKIVGGNLEVGGSVAITGDYVGNGSRLSGIVSEGVGATFQNSAQISTPHQDTFISSHPCRIVQSTTTHNTLSATGTNTSWATAVAIPGSTLTLTGFNAGNFVEVEWEGSFYNNNAINNSLLTVLLDGDRLRPPNADDNAPVFPYLSAVNFDTRYSGRYRHPTAQAAGTHTISLMAYTTISTWTWVGKSTVLSNYITFREVSCAP